MTAPTVNAPTVNAPCVCTDPEADRLRELIAAGMDQREASRLLWGPDSTTDPNRKDPQ